MGSLSHTVLMFSCFHLWNLCLYPFQKWSRNQTATLSGERRMDTSSSSSGLGWKKCRYYSLPSLRSFREKQHLGQHLCHTAFQCHRSLWHFLLSQVRLALHSVHCMLWVSSHGTWRSSAHMLHLGAAVLSTAPCPSSSMDLHQCCTDSGVNLNHIQLTIGVEDEYKEGGEQTIRKKWQAVNSG